MRRTALWHGRPWIVLLLGLAGVAGCGGPGRGRLAVSGSVRFDGQPLATGSIQFTPQDHAGLSSGGIIENGSYRLPRDKGLPPGKYLVRIFSPQEGAPEPSAPAVPGPTQDAGGPRQPPPAEERIPAAYNVESQQFIEVASGSENVFDFDIPG